MPSIPASRARLIDVVIDDVHPVLVNVNQEAVTRWARSELRPQATAGETRPDNAAVGAREVMPGLCFWLIAHALDFRLWSLTAQGEVVDYHYGRGPDSHASGFNGLVCALRAAWGESEAPAKLREAPISARWVEHHFGSALPDREARVKVLQEVLEGEALERVAEALFAKACAEGRIGIEDAARLADEFPLAYGGDPYLNKAQRAIAAAAGFIRDRGNGCTPDLTAMADHRLPRALRALGVLQFDPELAEAIDRRRLIAHGSAEEKAIRAASVLGVDALARELDSDPVTVTDLISDNAELERALPHHLTLTERY
jgi:hypothetical protein